MIIILELFPRGIRKADRHPWWKPLWFRGRWGSKKCWRLGWLFVTVCYYPSKDLHAFFDRAKNGQWYRSTGEAMAPGGELYSGWRGQE
jgi:hypothetical protein